MRNNPRHDPLTRLQSEGQACTTTISIADQQLSALWRSTRGSDPWRAPGRAGRRWKDCSISDIVVSTEFVKTGGDQTWQKEFMKVWKPASSESEGQSPFLNRRCSWHFHPVSPNLLRSAGETCLLMVSTSISFSAIGSVFLVYFRGWKGLLQLIDRRWSKYFLDCSSSKIGNQTGGFGKGGMYHGGHLIDFIWRNSEVL